MNQREEACAVVHQTAENKELIKMIISNPFKKSQLYHKITIEPHINNTSTFFQASLYHENKVSHENFTTAAALSERIAGLLAEYKQFDLQCSAESIKILTSKSGSVTIKRKSTENKSIAIQPHNKEKNYILAEGEPISWLISLGIMNEQGKVLADKQKKFRQINRFLEMVDDVSSKIPENAYIVDVGCGKSYLTFALYHYLNVIKNKNVSITGLDLKKDVVEYCQSLSKTFNFYNLQFINMDIAKFKLEREHADMVVTLHACDTATDYALANAIKWNTTVILSVPCCQHELFGQVENNVMKPLLKHGIFKERFSALLTDALRAQLLEACGYKCSVMEFIDIEHTPKNIMIRAIKKNNFHQNTEALAEYNKLADEYNISPTLFALLQERLHTIYHL